MFEKRRCCCEHDHLTAREIEVAALVAAGMSNQRIGRQLSLSQHTVASHILGAMRRLNAGGRTELVARCYALGLLNPQVWPPAGNGRRCIRQLGEDRNLSPAGTWPTAAPATSGADQRSAV